ncbi:MAG: hypothetical protein H6772_04150 [Pseudomonadales bacterium]|nr:hypothetical protein [Pseudomonadales bacterium]
MFSLFEYVGWFESLKNYVEKLVIPIYQVEISILQKAKTPYNFILFSLSKFKYMKQIETRYVLALSELSELDKLREENNELRKLVENRDILIEKTIITAPIVSLAYPAVGVGSVHGVEINNMVLFNGMLIGTIGEVDNYQSKVLLLSKSRKNKVLAKTESGVEGVVDGDGKNILMTQIPNNAELVDGERVVAIGQEGIARNTFIGILKVIENNPSSPTKTAIIKQNVSFYDVVLLEVK